MSGGGRRHNGPHNGHYNMAAMTIEYNGHHPPREPRKEENTLVRRSFRRSGDEWRADSRRCVWKKLAIRAFVSPITTTNFLSRSNILSFFFLFLSFSLSLSIFSFLYRSFISSFRSRRSSRDCRDSGDTWMQKISKNFSISTILPTWPWYIFLFLFLSSINNR